MKKFFFKVFIAGLVLSSCPRASDPQRNIFLDDSNNLSAIRNHSLLVISPKTPEQVVQVTATQEDGLDLIGINVQDPVLQSLQAREPYSTGYLQFVANPSVENQNIHCDITGHEKLRLKNTVHKIHNGGYVISADYQAFEGVTLNLEKGTSAIALQPKSKVFQVTEDLRNNPLALLLEGLVANHLPSTQAAQTHQGDTPVTQIVKAIKVMALNGQPSTAVIEGVVKWENGIFNMDVKFQNATLQIEPNTGFSFKPLN